MEEFKIETGIPIPARRATLMSAKWGLLEIGQSVVVSSIGRRHSALQYAKLHPPVRFTSKALPDGRIRIWRIA